jgi:signal transduction histidine kinase
MLHKDFAVILLDVNMPDMDGFETAELIRSRPRFERTPIIFVTGYNTSDIDRLEGYRLGAVDYLFLPVIPEVLKAKVSVFVELARQTQVIRRQAAYLALNNREQARQLDLIRKLNRDLREANQELESFSYTISHDLRTPLRSLKGYSEALLEDFGPTLPATARDYLGRIGHAADRMDRLTRDLLNYSRIAREAIRIQPVPLQEIVRDVLAQHGLARAAGAEIAIADGLLPVLAHPALLAQCLTNLLDNAIKFVPPEATPRVRIRTEARDANIRIWIEDNGIGIDPAHHQKIFGLFERAGNTRDYEGTGVGLAVVSRCVQRMNGELGVESTLGAGSRFWIELPAVQNHQLPAVAP